MGISKNIHLVFLRKDETIPPLFKECERKIRDMHPSWDITLWDEETGTQFLKDNLPEYVDAYAAFAHNVQRADFLRLALVYGLGGFYMDMDMYPLKALDSLLDKSLILAEEMTVNDETLKILEIKIPCLHSQLYVWRRSRSSFPSQVNECDGRTLNNKGCITARDTGCHRSRFAYRHLLGQYRDLSGYHTPA